MVVLRAFLALLADSPPWRCWSSRSRRCFKAHSELGRRTGKPKPGYIFVNLGYSFLAAAAGGYVTAWIAQHNPLVPRSGIRNHCIAAGCAQRAAAARSTTRLVHARTGGAYASGRVGGRPRAAARFRNLVRALGNSTGAKDMAALHQERPILFRRTNRIADRYQRTPKVTGMILVSAPTVVVPSPFGFRCHGGRKHVEIACLGKELHVAVAIPACKRSKALRRRSIRPGCSRSAR